MIAANSFPDAPVSILATDLSRAVLDRAELGEFSQLEVNRGLPAPMLVRHFERSGVRWRIREDIRRRVRFRQLNLARPWPVLPAMDVVMLRNVLIYFDKAARRAALAQVASVLAPDGVLLLGGAETTYGVAEGWERVNVRGSLFYRPTGAREGRHDDNDRG
jgi:chemotaxis protein methyltransferase CheR